MKNKLGMVLICGLLSACQLIDDKPSEPCVIQAPAAVQVAPLSTEQRIADYLAYLQSLDIEQLQWHYLDLQTQEQSSWQQLKLVYVYANGKSPVWNPHRAEKLLRQLLAEPNVFSQQALLLKLHDQLKQLLVQIHKNEALVAEKRNLEQAQQQYEVQLDQLNQQIDKLTQLEQQLHER